MIKEQKLIEKKAELSKCIKEIDKELERIKTNGIHILLDKIFDKIKEMKNQGLKPKCVIVSPRIMNYISSKQLYSPVAKFYDRTEKYRGYLFIENSPIYEWDEFYIGI